MFQDDGAMAGMYFSRRGKQKLCMVCGDNALSCNFGAITCESCKAFFRRHAIKKICGQCNGTCPVTVSTRSYCRKCRLLKCFSVGMRTDLILNDDQKRERREKIRDNKMRRYSFPNQDEEKDSAEVNHSGSVESCQTACQMANAEMPTPTGDAERSFKAAMTCGSFTNKSPFESQQTVSSTSRTQLSVHGGSRHSKGRACSSDMKAFEATSRPLSIFSSASQLSAPCAAGSSQFPGGDRNETHVPSSAVTLDEAAPTVSGDRVGSDPTPFPSLELNSSVFPVVSQDIPAVSSKPKTLPRSPIIPCTLTGALTSAPGWPEISQNTAMGTEKCIKRRSEYHRKGGDNVRDGRSAKHSHLPRVRNSVTEMASPIPIPTQRTSPTPIPTQMPSPIPMPTQRPFPIPIPTQRPSPIPMPTEMPYPIPMATKRPSPKPTLRPSSIPEPTQRQFPIPVPTQMSSPIEIPTERPPPMPTQNIVPNTSPNPEAAFGPVLAPCEVPIAASNETPDAKPCGKTNIENQPKTGQGAKSSCSKNKQIRKREFFKPVVSEALLNNLDEKSAVSMRQAIFAAETSFNKPHTEEAPTALGYTQMFNMGEAAIRRIIQMSKRILEFSKLASEDQITLLKSSVVEILIIRSSKTFDPSTLGWNVPTEREGAPHAVSSEAIRQHNPQFSAWFKQYAIWVTTLCRLTRSDDAIIMLIILVRLFSYRGNKELKDATTIAATRRHYSRMLALVIEDKYSDRAEAQDVISSIDSVLKELDSINNIQELILRSNIDELEPLIVEIFEIPVTKPK